MRARTANISVVSVGRAARQQIEIVAQIFVEYFTDVRSATAFRAFRSETEKNHYYLLYDDLCARVHTVIDLERGSSTVMY